MLGARIMFFGTPDFAAASLRGLIDNDENIVGVVTQPDRPKGRNRKMAAPPVKVLAEGRNIPVYQPASVRTAEFLEWFRGQQVDLAIVAAYGKIIPKELLDIPPCGFVNVHASLLPRHRGASPIQTAVVMGDEESGITIMQMDVGLDTGDILLTSKAPINPDMTAADLHNDLAMIGGEAIVDYLCDLRTNSLKPQPQDDTQATYAPLLKKTDGEVSWDKPASSVYNHVRGMFPWPGAYTFHGDKRIRLYPLRGFTTEMDSGVEPGTIVRAEGDEIVVACGTGTVALGAIQLEGRKAVAPHQFLQGYELPPGAKLGQKK